MEKKKKTSGPILALCACLLLPGPLTAGTVKKKDGTVVEGEIQGTLVQRGRARSAKDNKVVVGYRVTEGEHVTVIDEEGVQAVSQKALYVDAFGAGIAPAEREVLSPATLRTLRERLSTAAGAVEMLPNGTRLFASYFMAPKDQVPQTYPLLGELRSEGDNVVIVPTVRVATKKGIVDIPVHEIVAFKEEAKKE